MNLLMRLFHRIDATVATANPFMVDVVLAWAGIVLLAWLAFECALRGFRRRVEQPLVDAAQRDRALQPFLRPQATLSGAATKGFRPGYTHDDYAVDEASRRRGLDGVMQVTERRVH